MLVLAEVCTAQVCMALYCTGTWHVFEVALYSSVLQGCSILVQCMLMVLAELCTAYIWLCIALEPYRGLNLSGSVQLCAAAKQYIGCVYVDVSIRAMYCYVLLCIAVEPCRGFEVALYSSVLQRCRILAQCVLIFLAEQCTAYVWLCIALEPCKGLK